MRFLYFLFLPLKSPEDTFVIPVSLPMCHAYTFALIKCDGSTRRSLIVPLAGTLQDGAKVFALKASATLFQIYLHPPDDRAYANESIKAADMLHRATVSALVTTDTTIM